jgi:5-methylthioadenosine/S-adenosylhomocysteine deaminase
MEPVRARAGKRWILVFASLFFGASTLSCGAGNPEEELQAPSSSMEPVDEDLEGGESLAVQGFAATTCTPTSTPVWAVGGTLLTPNGPVEGHVVVRGDHIDDIVPKGGVLPAGALRVDTGGVIAPGLVDLHNHVTYNFLSRWTPPQLYTNRYQWARTSAYAAVVKDPYGRLRAGSHLCQAQKFGELRALAGGTTTIQGSLGYSCQNGWVRNVEASNFCKDRVRQYVLPISSLSVTDASNLVVQFNAGVTVAFLVHLAEGTDASSSAELSTLKTLRLLRKETVIIHGTALSPAQLQEVGTAKMSIVWSPSSNLALYGQTLDVPSARKAGVRLALAPDWSATGSGNLLGELKVADRLNRTTWAGLLSDVDLFRMVTENPADMVGMGDKLGRLVKGAAADLLIVRPSPNGAYRALIDARPQDVLLTAVGGRPLYGLPSWMNALGRAGTYELVNACHELRGLSVRDTAISGGTETLQDVLATFVGDDVTAVSELVDCASPTLP